jgi:lysozyme family protein
MADPKIAIQRTLRNEDSTLSGKVITDTGGLTRWGISQRAYPGLDIKNLSLDQAIEIYKKDYWTALNIDKLTNQTMADIIYDMAVNAGKSVASKMAQNAIVLSSEFKVTVDGSIGPNTLFLLNQCNPAIWVAKYVELRIAFYKNLVDKDPKKNLYLKGWINRANSYLPKGVN